MKGFIKALSSAHEEMTSRKIGLLDRSSAPVVGTIYGIRKYVHFKDGFYWMKFNYSTNDLVAILTNIKWKSLQKSSSAEVEPSTIGHCSNGSVYVFCPSGERSKSLKAEREARTLLALNTPIHTRWFIPASPQTGTPSDEKPDT